MPRVYVVKHDAIAVAGAITIIQVKMGAASTGKVISFRISQSNSTTSAQLRIQLLRKSAAATVTSYTPLLFDPGDGAAKAVGGTAATGITASAEGTNTDILHSATFNALSGYLYMPSPEERPVIGAAGIIGLTFPANPALTITAELVFEETGG